MPLGTPDAQGHYGQMFHYSNLGKTIPEILLSPVLKSRVFFGELFGVENFYFAGMLFASCIGCVFAPRFFVVLLPSFIGVCLLNGSELSNIAMQYQVEIFAVLTAGVISGTAAAGTRSAACKTAVCATTVAGSVLCAFFVGRQPWGFYSYFNEMTRKNHKEMIIQQKRLIPPGKKLQTFLGYQAHFMCRNELSGFENKTIDEQADYILLPFSDNFTSGAELRELFQTIMQNRNFRILAHNPERGCGFVLFSRIK